MSDSLQALQSRVTAFRDSRDWAPLHKPKDLVLALAAEAGELAEVVLWKDDETLGSIKRCSTLWNRLGDEMADVLIYLLSLAEIAGIELGEAVVRKLELNARRYPVDTTRGRAPEHRARREQTEG